MTDTNYNVGLTKFPKMMTGIANNDLGVVGREYGHYSGGLPLGSRNEMRKSFFLKNMAMEQGMAVDRDWET